LAMSLDAGGKLCSCSFVRAPARISTIKQEGALCYLGETVSAQAIQRDMQE
jgi:hypothetical protein